MGIFNDFYGWVEREVITRANDKLILVEAAVRRGMDSPSKMLEYEAQTMEAKTLKDWKEGVGLATDPDEPDRGPLARLHDNLMIDDDLASTIETRIGFVQQSPFKFVDQNENENKELTKLFKRPWFKDCQYKVLFSQFSGVDLLEFFHLTAEGELAEVGQIPQSHFNAKKGIVMKAAGDTTGWSYREGQYANYYVQVGRHDSLGILTYVAPIVLAKKLGMGSLLDYVEKYGVPPIFITTDREDDTRIKELFNAAANFKANHFMVGRGAEKFEIGNIGGTGVAPHEMLIKICNERISKRILGASSITDEKAFVGTAEVQERLAKIRFESDKLHFQHIFNAHIRPILIKLSPVYAPLATHTLEWDESETRTWQQLIDAIVALGAQYDIDPEFISQTTGIPILGAKQTPVETDTPAGGGAAKK